MAKDQPFEIPQQLRELAERNVEQGRAAYGQFMDAMVQASSMWWSTLPANEASSHFKAVQDRSISFAKQNAEAGFNMARDVANVKGSGYRPIASASSHTGAGVRKPPVKEPARELGPEGAASAMGIWWSCRV